MSFDELGRPLRDITFCVVDLETTGGSAQAGSMITEIGAVKVRGGEVLGEFQTLVNPHTAIPPFIAVLTGITNSMVASSPPIESALPAFLEFAQGTVLVAHNAPFDVGFLKHFAELQQRPWPAFEVLDTARLARRVVTRDDAPNCKLSSLAVAFGSTTTPNHRALSDARATVDVLHGLMERLGGLGVHTLEELQTFSSRVSPAVRRKRHLAEHLPHSPGVYLFRDEQERVLYVGTSRDLRARVRSYFTASETRSRMGEMVNLAASVTGIECATPLEARVRELSLIAAHKPRYNRRSRHPEKMHWLKLTVEPWPRLRWSARWPRTAPTTSARSRHAARPRSAWPHSTRPFRSGSAATACRSRRTSPRACSPRWGAASRPVTAALGRPLRSPGGRGARQPAAPGRPGRRGARRPDGPAGRRRAVRGGRRASRPALRLRPRRVSHPTARLALVLLRAGGRPPRGRPTLGRPRRPSRSARRIRRDPSRRTCRRVGHPAPRVRRVGGPGSWSHPGRKRGGVRADPALARAARSAPRPRRGRVGLPGPRRQPAPRRPRRRGAVPHLSWCPSTSVASLATVHQP